MRFGAASRDRLRRFATLVQRETAQQNLIAASTIGSIWARHIVDSAQLVSLAPRDGTWLDVGTGAGFPGLIVAALRPEPTVLVEPRRLRAAFLSHAVSVLGITNVQIVTSKIEHLQHPSKVVSARAVAPVERLLCAASACATMETRWLLPRGRQGAAELRSLGRRWSGEFHVKQSITDELSSILILDGVSFRHSVEPS